MVIDLLMDVNRTDGRTLVLVTHDVELAARADRLVRLCDGRIVDDVGRAAGAEGAR